MPVGGMNDRPSPHIDIDQKQKKKKKLPRKINYWMESSGKRAETSMKTEDSHIKVSFHDYATIIEVSL